MGKLIVNFDCPTTSIISVYLFRVNLCSSLPIYLSFTQLAGVWNRQSHTLIVGDKTGEREWVHEARSTLDQTARLRVSGILSFHARTGTHSPPQVPRPSHWQVHSGLNRSRPELLLVRCAGGCFAPVPAGLFSSLCTYSLFHSASDLFTFSQLHTVTSLPFPSAVLNYQVMPWELTEKRLIRWTLQCSSTTLGLRCWWPNYLL